MSLREYILRRQARLRDTVETIKLETIPVLNALSGDTITVEDFFRGAPGRSSDELKAFRYEVEARTDLVDDWSLLDPDLADSTDPTPEGSAD